MFYDMLEMLSLEKRTLSWVHAVHPLKSGQQQPASLDLRLGKKAYAVRGSFLPSEDCPLQSALQSLSDEVLNLEGDGALFKKSHVYIVPLMESLSLPEEVLCISNAKSSSGRLDMFVRLMCESGKEIACYDRTPFGYEGSLYAEISSRSFDIVLKAGDTLNQIRFAKKSVKQKTIERMPIRMSLEEEGGVVGWVAKKAVTRPLVFDSVGRYRAEDFWEPVKAKEGWLSLLPDNFYILRSHESVSIPLSMTAELCPYEHSLGAYRLHYAGFFDPGFGLGAPSRAVLEIRVHETPMLLSHKQVVGQLTFYPLNKAVARPYGAALGSHYQGQGLRLSRQFFLSSQ